MTGSWKPNVSPGAPNHRSNMSPSRKRAAFSAAARPASETNARVCSSSWLRWASATKTARSIEIGNPLSIRGTIAQDVSKETRMPLLAGIRVLDLSLQLPGPFCTLMMADYGADVVKVDEPEPRVRNPFAADDAPGLSPSDRYLNRGKRSLTLNLKTDEGKEIFRTLAEGADVVVEGFRPGVTERLGVDYGTLSARNPRLVYCSISGY